MAEAREHYTIAQFSDIHCGDPRFDASLMEETIAGINGAAPDLVILAGDLTAAGYREQFEEAKRYFDLIGCGEKIVIAGNHDTRNVGYLHFEELFGERHTTRQLDFSVLRAGDGEEIQEHIRILALDSTKPDMNDGEIGRRNYKTIRQEFAEEEPYKIFVLHHHLVSIPNTGRERNVVWDSGDVLQQLKDMKCDLVLHGHRHVPYNWPVGNTLIVSSGTASTWRTRGYVQPSYNLIEINSETVTITNKQPGGGEARRERFHRRPRPPVAE